MPDELTVEQKAAAIAAQLDHDHIAEAAIHAGHALNSAGVAVLELTPGDSTRYDIVIARTPVWSHRGIEPPRNYMFSTSFGPVYPWRGNRMHFDYVLEKWVANKNLWTAVVLATFMTALAERLNP